MGYGQALLAKDVAIEKRELEKKAKKKGLWGSIGGTLLGGIATLATGGMASPVLAGLAQGGAAGLGKMIGSKAAGDLPQGKFFESSRSDLNKMFDQDILGTALKGALTGGLGAKTSLGGQAGKGMDFGGSILGKGIDKIKSAKSLVAGGMDKGLSKTLTGAKLGGSGFDLDMVKGAMNQGAGGLKGNLLSQVGQQGFGMDDMALNRITSTSQGPSLLEDNILN